MQDPFITLTNHVALANCLISSKKEGILKHLTQELLSGLNESIQVKCLEQYLTLIRFSINVPKHHILKKKISWHRDSRPVAFLLGERKKTYCQVITTFTWYIIQKILIPGFGHFSSYHSQIKERNLKSFHLFQILGDATSKSVQTKCLWHSKNC